MRRVFMLAFKAGGAANEALEGEAASRLSGRLALPSSHRCTIVTPAARPRAHFNGRAEGDKGLSLR